MLLDLPLEDDSGQTAPRRDAPAALALHDVRFGFGGRPVLDHFSFRAEPGERVALVGPGGSGKSLTLDLVQRLRQPESGFVTFDDVDVRLYRLDALRDQVARAGETEVFSGSVLDNVRLLRPTVSATDVDAALGRLGLADTVRALPLGLDTPLSTHGWPLSPAQVTTLMLARAIVTKPRLLLLDEAFTGIEEPLRSRALDGVFAPDAPWTVLVVTDREDVLARCDRIVDLTRTGAAPDATDADAETGE
jgi:ABC-type multidrug transport system fused ATPase/permease subunit